MKNDVRANQSAYYCADFVGVEKFKTHGKHSERDTICQSVRPAKWAQHALCVDKGMKLA
jgi:hypothetical protein